MDLIKIFLLVSMIVTAGCSMPRAIVTPGPDQRTALRDEVSEIFPEGMNQHEKTGFHYKFEYDRNNLYIMLVASDPDVIRKIVYFGFTVWIDRDGGKNRDQGFRFPTGMSMTQLQRQAGRAQGTPAGSIFGDPGYILKRADDIELIGIYGTAARTVKMRDSQIRVNCEIAGDLFIYEASVPFELLEYGYNPVMADAGINIGFETGHFTPPSVRSRQRPQQGIRTGDGMRPAGGMQGQYPGRVPDRIIPDQGAAGMAQMSRPTRLWISLEFDR